MIHKETEKKLISTNKRNKFKIGSFVFVDIDDRQKLTLSKKLKERHGKCGIVVGYRNYYVNKRNYGGNRYYVRFMDGYTGGYFPWHLKEDDLKF